MQTPSTVLIVDDEPLGRRLLEDMLVDQGYRLVSADTGLDAVDKAKEFTPDIVLLDVMLPDIDGFEVCRRLRADGELREVPIIFLTALDDRPSRLAGIEAGGDDFLTKPYDVTELRLRVRTITQLNRHRQLLAERANSQRIIDASPNGLVILDREGTIHLTNPAMQDLCQLQSGEEWTGRNVTSLVAPNDTVRFSAWLRDFSRGESRSSSLELELLHTKGKSFPAELTASAFSWNGQMAIQVHVRDLTEKKRLEGQLLHTQRLQSLGTLASGVAHDLNNVLSPIFSGISLFRDELKDESNLRLLAVMESSANRGRDIVKQILTFSRSSESQRVPLLPKHTIKEIHRMLVSTLPPDYSVRVIVSPDLWPVMADPTQCYQALMNLSVNARDAMPNGGKLVIEGQNIVVDESMARLQEGSRPGKYVRLSVCDSGIGMTEEVRNRIFEPFFTTKEKGKGTGLGLATVMSIARHHDGFVTVESRVNKGSQFHLYLPALDKTLPAEAEGHSIEELRGSGQLLLLVDDDHAVLEVTRMCLEKNDYRVLTAADGVEALALYAQRTQDVRLVLADLLLPCLDGASVLRVMRRMNPNVAVLATTAQLDHTLRPSLAGLEDVPILSKPFSTEALLTLIREALGSPVHLPPAGVSTADL
jgi:two-component system cell cycle sensor histidine kinase/response regulator CckA